MMELRISPDRESVDIETGANVTVADWFVFNINNGGGYTDGVREGVDKWTPLEIPEPEIDDSPTN